MCLRFRIGTAVSGDRFAGGAAARVQWIAEKLHPYDETGSCAINTPLRTYGCWFAPQDEGCAGGIPAPQD